MTTEEAREILSTVLEYTHIDCDYAYDKADGSVELVPGGEISEALTMAIAALRAQQERENSEPKGLFGKYIVRKASDGTPIDNCFVLRPEKDPAAITAIRAYAEVTDNSTLATDLLQWVGEEKPLTLDELREMNAPVWCLCKPIEGGNGYWCMCQNGHITTPAGTQYFVSEIPHWVFLRHKPKEESKC